MGRGQSIVYIIFLVIGFCSVMDCRYIGGRLVCGDVAPVSSPGAAHQETATQSQAHTSSSSSLSSSPARSKKSK